MIIKKLLLLLLLASPCLADNVLLNNNGDTTAYMILGRDTIKAINMMGSYANIRFSNGQKFFLKNDTTWGGVGSVDWSAVLNKPVVFTPDNHYQGWATITDPPATYAPSAHSQAWSTITSQPTIPIANDSAGIAGTANKLQGLDTTTLKSRSLPVAGVAANSSQLQTLDTTKFIRTARVIRLMVDSVKVIAAKRTAIALTGVLATDRAWVSFADSTSGVRKRSVAGICKANSLIVHCDTTVATVNYLIYR